MKNERKVSFSWPPHPLLFFSRLPLLPTILFFSQASSLFIWIHLILIDIHHDLRLCTSFLVRIAGGGAAPLPPAPPHPLLFLIGSPCYLLFFFCFHKHHRLFGFILNFIFIDIHRDLCLCASFLVRIAGGGAAPSPLHPPTRFYFLIDFPCYLLSFIFS